MSSSDLPKLGGTAHWFHVPERLLPQVLRVQERIETIMTNMNKPRYRNDTILIVFREWEGAEQLSQFNQLIIAAMTGAMYKTIVFGYLEGDSSNLRSSSEANKRQTLYEGSVISMEHFRVVHITDLSSPGPVGRFRKVVSEKGGISAASAGILASSCMVEIMPLHWTKPGVRKELLVDSRQEFMKLRSAIGNICGLRPNIKLKDNDSSKVASPDDAELQSLYTENHCIEAISNKLGIANMHSSNADRSKQQKKLASRYGKTINADMTLVSKSFARDQWETQRHQTKKYSIFRGCDANFNNLSVGNNDIVAHHKRRKVVIYQRDQTRKIGNLQDAARHLESQLKSHSVNISHRGVDYDVSVLFHSESRPVCQLVRQVALVDVLLAPHGFQNMLLLIQPLRSILLEIHPKHLFKPKVYGAIQYGIRDIAMIPRGYLAQESYPKSAVAKALFLYIFPALGITSSADCLRSSICRYAAKQQDVWVDEAFLDQAAIAIQELFGSADVGETYA